MSDDKNHWGTETEPRDAYIVFKKSIWKSWRRGGHK